MSLRVHATPQSGRASPSRPRRYSALPPSLHLGSCRASSSDSGKKDSRNARDPPKASSDMSFCISPLPDCRGPEARTHMGRSGFPHRRCSPFTTRATHDRHRAVVWFKKKDNPRSTYEDASRDRTRFLVTPLLMSSLRRWPHQFHSAARTGNFSTCHLRVARRQPHQDRRRAQANF